MGVLTFGINHQTADISFREHLAVGVDCLYDTLKALIRMPSIHEVVFLSTCNRTEIITNAPNSQQLFDWLVRQYQIDPEVLKARAYCYEDYQAIKHIMRVACGLDSIVLGEPQILGQVKQAYHLACQAGSVGHELKHLFPAVFSASKKVRQQTNLGYHALSLAFLVYQIVRKNFSSIRRSRVLLIGASQTNHLIARYFYEQGVGQFTIANRSLEQAKRQARALSNAQTISLAQLPDQLAYADIVVTATSSPYPIVGKRALEAAQRLRKYRPMLLIDLAVPRNIEPEAHEIEEVHLYNLDDLHTLVDRNLFARQKAALKAEQLIDNYSLDYLKQQRVIKKSAVIASFRHKAYLMQKQELNKASKQWKKGADPQTLLTSFSKRLTNKLLHPLTVVLRHALANHDQQTMTLLDQLLD